MVLKSWSASHVKPKVLVRWRCQDGRSGEDWHSSRLVVSGLSCFPSSNAFHSRPLRPLLHQHRQSPELWKWGAQSINCFASNIQYTRTSGTYKHINLICSIGGRGLGSSHREHACVCVHDKSLKHPRKLLKRPVSLVKYF